VSTSPVMLEHTRKVDLLVADCQYSTADYETHRGYGHSSPEQVAGLASQAGVRQLGITHHGLQESDRGVRDKLAEVTAALGELGSKLKPFACSEGAEIQV
jgi:ribonuclease BN (tRNA processing enzyme)